MMPTTREFLGDSLIKELEGAGFSPQSINAFAKNEYRQRKAAQEEEQKRLLYRADDMKLNGKVKEALLSGDISEEEARNAQKFEDFGAKKHGWGLGAAKTLTGIANTVERVGDFVNPFYEGKHDENGNYTYQNSIEQALRPKIQNAEKLRDDYEKATGETSWGSRLAEIGTEMVGDPINFIGGAGLLSKGSKLAQFGKKTLFFAGTGAASGGVMALGEGKNDEETLKNIGYGAAGGFVLGHAIDQGIQGISKLIAKRQASRVANEADAIDNAQNSEFLDGGNSASGDGVGAELKEAQTMTAREFASKEAGLDEDTAKKVVKEAMQGKEKSDWTDADTYADIVKFKNFEIQRDYAKAYGERIQTAQASINNAREQSAIRYADTQKAINEYQKQGISPSATRELINAKFKPSADEIDYTRAYNDGSDVDARLAGQGIFYALEKDIAAQTYTPEIYAVRLKQRGFSDESVQAFTQAYINKDINIAKDYANSKVADAYENKIQREVANEIRDRDEVGGRFVNEEAKNNGLSDSISNIGDNASRTGGRQASDEQILRQGRRNTSSASQTKRTAQSDEQMEQRSAFKTDGDTDAAASRKRMVEEQGNGDNEIRGENFITKESPEPKSDLNVKMDLAPNVRDLSKITTDEISADLDYLANKHPEMFKKPSDVFKLVKEIKNEPTHFFNNNRLDYALIVKRVGDNKIGKLAVDKESGEVKHATKVKEKDIKRLDRISRENSKNAGIIQTFIQPGSKSNSELGLPSEIIPKQTQEEYKKLVNEYDVDKFLSDRENVLSKDARHGKNRITDRTIESNEGVGGWEYKLTPAGYEKNYKADFLTTKADVAKIRAGKMDEATFNKLKSDLESSDALGYEYKKASEYADMEDFEREFGSLYNPKGGRNINANSHIASGLVGGTLNSIDEDGNFNPEKFAAGFIAGLAGSKAVAIAARKMTPQFYNKILGVANKMPQMANGNPRLLGKLYSNGKDVSLNSFAGEKAITANVGKLDQAKAMLEKGTEEVEIWQKTGWFKDRDGAWKFEIGDSKARLNPNFKSGGRLGELLEHEELFKAYPELKDISVKKIGDDIPDGAALSVKNTAQREKRGIYNVAYNDKSATLVRHDLEKIDNALMFEKGSSKKGGAIHIKKHLEPEAQGAITQSELLNIGKNIREYLQKYKEPFIDEHGGRIYEWANKEGVKFRVVVYEKIDGISASHPETIISFYSNRNLKKPMEFRNPEVKYDVNLRQWHKDSAPITKNADGSPKVFYHGSNEGGLSVFKRQPEGSGYGFWFTVSQKQANEYASAELIPGYLKITKPFEIEKINDYDTLKNIFGLSEKAFKEFQTERQIWRKAIEKLRVRGFRIADKDHLGFMLYDKNGDYIQTPNQMLVHDVHTLRDASNDELAHFVYDKYYDRYVTGEVDVLAAILNKNDYDVGKNFLRNKLKKAGYDGIKIDDNVIVVFDSAQIKHVKNNGNFSDSPNIYKSGKEGYYSPTNNEIGLSDLGDKSTLMHEVQHAIQDIEGFAKGSSEKGESYRLSHGEAEARNVQNRLNLDDTVGIHPHETFDVNPNETIVSKEDGISYSRRIEEIKREHPNVEKELDESIATMNKESFNDSNFKDGLIGKFDTKEITTQQLGKSINLSNKQLTILKNDIKNADFKVINESKIYFDKMGKDGDKKRFFIDIAEDGNIRVDAYAKSQIDSIPIKENALQELAGVGDRARLKNMSFEVKAAYRNELDPIKKEAILKTAELNKLKKAAQSGDKVAVAKFEEFKAKNLDKDGNIKDGLRLC
ncbi:LPD23 domain-containing protein [uncultured Campylobacter sp.]|uniref:ADP-ribosyltransferase-containing protein n=1 Tax=uncultured Campylobacter sp. TaxID=218934 RepID=UPI0015BBAEDE|nr:LPD23 domain-containing protein [uncultured Campylobacter sp.]